MMIRSPAVALEGRLKHCRNVITLGVKPNWEDYDATARRLILEAEKVYYPSSFYAPLLDAMGKKIFPSPHTYHCAQDKIRQTTMFQVAGIPHPKTRIYFGKRQAEKILDNFEFPFVAKVARGSSLGKGVYLINTPKDLSDYLKSNNVVYLQEYLPSDRDIRVVVIGRQVVHSYWRVNAPGDFRSNVFQGGRIELDSVPPEAVALGLKTAMDCGWNDVGVDILVHKGRYFVLEGNMKYGRRGFRKAGIDYHELMERLIENGNI